MDITENKALEEKKDIQPSIVLERTDGISSADLNKKSLIKFELDKLTPLSPIIATIASEIAKASTTANAMKDVYRCVFPAGVTGRLLPFKYEDAFTGTILNSSGAFSQARWVPVPNMPLLAKVNWASIILSFVVANINKKLDECKQLQQKTLDFLMNDRKYKLDGALAATIELYQDYPHHLDDDTWITATIRTAQSEKNHAHSTIISYQSALQETIKEQDGPHSTKDAVEFKRKVLDNLMGYQRSIQLYALCSFLESLLSENNSEAYYASVQERVDSLEERFQSDYNSCYSAVMDYYYSSKGKNMELVSEAAIAAIGYCQKESIENGKRPLIDFKAIGEKKSKKSEEKFDNFIKDLDLVEDTYIEEIAQGVNQLRAISSKRSVLLFDEKFAYVLEEPQPNEEIAKTRYEEIRL